MRVSLSSASSSFKKFLQLLPCDIFAIHLTASDSVFFTNAAEALTTASEWWCDNCERYEIVEGLETMRNLNLGI